MKVLKFADWILSTPAWLQALPENLQRIFFQFYQTFIYEDRWTFFVDGLKVTFIVTIGALLLGVIIGMIVGILRSTHDSYRAKKPPILLRIINFICQIYLTVIRGTPMMVQLLIMGFVIMVPKSDAQTIACAVLTLGINSGAYVAEIARSGIMSINGGQMEAGRSLGLNYVQTMRYIIIPQAFKNILPALGNEFIVLLKETSISGYIALQDLTKGGDIIRSRTYDAFMPLLAVALIYLCMVLILEKLVGMLERRLSRSDRR